MEILERQMQMTFPNVMYGASEHHVKTSLLQESEKDLMEIEAALLKKCLDLLETPKKKIDPNTLSMKMLRECCHY